MSRIIIVLTDPPLPFGNASARWYYVLLRGLAGRGHAVTAFAVSHDAADAGRVAELFPSPAHDVRLYRPPKRGGLRAKLESIRQPYSYLFGQDLRRDLRAELARGFDVLHLEQLWTGWLGLHHSSRALLHIHYLFRIDLAHRPQRSLYDRGLWAATLAAERRLLRSYPTISTLTPRLTDAVRRISPRSTVHTVPLGMDLALYSFEPPGEPSGPPTVALIGSFHWEPTLSAGVRLLTRLWPEIKRRVPAAQLQLVGRRARSALSGLAIGPDVSIFEDVPDTIPYFRSSDVLLYAPGPASGMKVKVMEAIALGAPVVTTADGVEGLPAEDGVHVGLAEDDAGLIDRTVALLLDPSLRARRAIAARALLEAHCGPGPTLDRLEEVYATLGRPVETRGKSGPPTTD
jgi:glycosyltransferase involved in cell wall biosynthesis